LYILTVAAIIIIIDSYCDAIVLLHEYTMLLHSERVDKLIAVECY
jgi:hypothetical protein